MGILFLLSGCTRQVGYGNSIVTVKVGKSFYLVPNGMRYSSAPISYAEAKSVNTLGLPCKKRDIIWMTTGIKRSVDNHKYVDVASSYKRRLIGCAHPRSKPTRNYSKSYQRKRIYTCSQLTRTQAYALLRAGHTYLDRDHDGHPCEWRKRKVRKRYYPVTYRRNCHYVNAYYRSNGTYVRGYTRCR